MKILKNIKLGLAGIVGVAITLATYEFIDILKKPNSLLESIDRIYLMEKQDFDKKLPKTTAAYTFYDQESKKINVVLKKDYKKRELSHEAGHAKHLELNLNNSDFSEKWNKNRPKWDIENSMYFDLGIIRVKESVLNSRSYDSEYEDVASFVEAISYEKTPEKIKTEIEKNNKQIDEENLTKNLDLSPLFFADTTDHRYQKKLDLLKEYNFLTNEEHEKLSKNLGSLNYLLKEKTK